LDYASKKNFTKIRFTGGEPLLHPGIVDFIKMAHARKSFQDISITTNGVLLEDYAESLKKAGISRLNISLDTLKDDKFQIITGKKLLKKILRGIEKAKSQQIPIKINSVVGEYSDEKDISELKTFAKRNGLKLQFIKEYKLTKPKEFDITYDRPPKCELCNRLRILPNYTIKPCLHSDLEIPINFDNLDQSFTKAILDKPAHGYICNNRPLYEIGR